MSNLVEIYNVTAKGEKSLENRGLSLDVELLAEKCKLDATQVGRELIHSMIEDMMKLAGDNKTITKTTVNTDAILCKSRVGGR